MAKPTKLDSKFRKGKISRREYEEQKIITGEFLRWHTKIYSQTIIK
jgi:hypothetical protein